MIWNSRDAQDWIQYDKSEFKLEVKITQQKIHLLHQDRILKEYPISSSKYGVGSVEGSFKTPLGQHRIAQMIGKSAPIYSVFKERENTGKLALVNKSKTESKEDIISSRILWLEGSEPGVNKGEGVDSFKRYIYIHGTSDEGLIGQTASHGCIRMMNRDVIELFDLVAVGTPVDIQLN